MMRKFIVFSIVSVCALYANFSHAQTSITKDYSNVPGIGTTATDIDVDVDPEYPSAFDTVTMRLNSNIVDLNRVAISWYVNGTKTLDGIGQRSLKVKIGDYGSINDIAVRITLDNSKVIQKTIDLSPADITMMYQAIDAYAPPFYPGKRIAPSEGIVRIVAIPNFTSDGSIMDSSKGVYIWKRNKKALPGSGGYSKNYLTIKNDKLVGDEDFTVRASNIDNSANGEKTFTLSPLDPVIHFYQKVYNQPNFAQALDSGFTMNTNSTTVVGVPYFFSRTSSNWSTDNDINWTLNDAPLIIEDMTKPFTLVLNNPGSAGTNTLALSLKSNTNIFQEATNSFKVSFK